jgi:hypothetical protein
MFKNDLRLKEAWMIKHGSAIPCKSKYASVSGKTNNVLS